MSELTCPKIFNKERTIWMQEESKLDELRKCFEEEGMVEKLKEKMDYHWKKILRIQGGLEFLKSDKFKKKENNNG